MITALITTNTKKQKTEPTPKKSVLFFRMVHPYFILPLHDAS